MNQLQSFLKLVKTKLLLQDGSSELNKIERCLNYIIAVHYRHCHHDGRFFVYHPVSVASILVEEAGCKDIDVICAAILHDVFEKCDIDVESFKEIFGARVYSLVDALTKYRWLGLDDTTRTINYVKRLEESIDESRIIKLADRLDNHRKLLCRNFDDRKLYCMKTEKYFSVFAAASKNSVVLTLWSLILSEITKMK